MVTHTKAAAPARLSREERLNHALEDIAAMAAEIPETAAEWPRLSDGERAGFAAEWDNYMAGVTVLIGAYYEGDLTRTQCDRLFALVRKVENDAPLLAQMGLHGPDLLNLEVLLFPERYVSSGQNPIQE